MFEKFKAYTRAHLFEFSINQLLSAFMNNFQVNNQVAVFVINILFNARPYRRLYNLQLLK